MLKMGLGAKLACAFGTLVLISVAVGMLALWNLRTIEHDSAALTGEYVPEVRVSSLIERSSHETLYAMRGYRFTREKQSLEEGKEKIAETRKAIEEASQLAASHRDLRSLKEGIDQANGHLAELDTLVQEAERREAAIEKAAKALSESTTEYLDQIKDYLHDQYDEMKDEIQAGADAGKLEERRTKIAIVGDMLEIGHLCQVAVWKSQALRDPGILRDARQYFDAVGKKIQELKNASRKAENPRQLSDARAAADTYKQAIDDLLTNWEAMDGLLDRQTALGKATLELVKRISNEGMEQTVGVGRNAASRVSFASITTKGGLVAATLVGLLLAVFGTVVLTRPVRRIIEGLEHVAGSVETESLHIEGASRQLAEGASQQAAALEETSSSLEEMASMTKQTSQNAMEANASMRKTLVLLKDADAAMKELGGSMDAISAASDETQKIVRRIDEIAFQTNLLALNAAVEAARAGEAGAGFAVVADEVRNLALHAAEAARQTAELIDTTVTRIHAGTAVASRVGSIYADVASGAERTAALVSEIHEASSEQAQGIDQINKAAGEMDQTTQQNAAHAEELAASSQELACQTEEMTRLVSGLITFVEGRRPSHVRPIQQITPPEAKVPVPRF